MIHFYCFLSLKTFQSQVHGMKNLMIPFSHFLKVSVINFCSWAPALNMHDCIKTEKSHLFRSSQYDNTSSEDCPWKPAGNVWEISPKIWAFKPQESNLTTGRNDTKNIFSRQQQPQLLNCVCSASSQCVRPPLNQRTAATAVTRLPATASFRRPSLSTSATRATPWRATTSSSPVRTASGTVPCRLAAGSHKVSRTS